VFVTSADVPGGWRNPLPGDWTFSSYSLFPGFFNGSREPIASPPCALDRGPIRDERDVLPPSLAPITSDKSFWEIPTRYNSMRNHPFSSNYPTGQEAPGVFSGQNTAFWDGHAQWRDSQTITDMMYAHPIWLWAY
jgi:prepilin-type processing-associated H-X9-DG protein